MLWLWTPQERYVYQPEYSSFHVPGVAGPEELIVACISAFATKEGRRCERNAMILTQWALSA